MNLDIDQLRRLDGLLDEVLQLPQAQRARWMDTLPTEHADLKEVLQKALERKDAACLELPKIPGAESTHRAGDEVGPFELIRPLGQGGMAQVWLARKKEGSVKREVALKIPQNLDLRGDLKARFELEQQILAGLEHPNIARLYDAGVDSRGLSYLAMEYVDGRPITAWCDLLRMRLKDRIAIFLQVLDAVEYAHKKGILHRDIKPSNVLVTQDGQVRLLDFGVAKLLEQDAQLTREYGRVLTPAYASPEQLGDGHLDATSDVYSLGVLLYELLSGSAPRAAESPTTAATGIEPASTRIDADVALARGATQSQVRSTLKGDLDAILGRALAPLRADRYRSTAEFARDLKNFLEHRPVQAHGRSLFYATRRFLERNWAISSVLALAALLLVGSVAFEMMRGVRSNDGPQAPVVQAVIPEKSIAVLPFLDISQRHNQDYFADGLSEELIDRLARVPDLKVIARTSSFTFKGKAEDVRTIGAKLGVAYLLEGSVRRDGAKLRATAQLVRTSDGTHVWSRSYDGETVNVFRVQDEIAGSIAAQLDASIMTGLPLGTNDPETHNLDAREAYYRALSAIRMRAGLADDKRAIAFLRKAVALDPNFASAWANLAAETFEEAAWDDGAGPDVSQRYKSMENEAKTIGLRALKLNPRLPVVHAALARIYILGELDLRKGQAEVDQALAIEPRYEWALTWRAILAAYRRQFEKARLLMQESLSLDPLHTKRWLDVSGIEYSAGDIDAALAADDRYIAGNPLRAQDRNTRGQLLFAKGLAQAALDEMGKDPDIQSRESCSWCIQALDALSRTREADERLAKLVQHHSYHNEYGIGRIFASRGQVDQAFAWFERAYEQRDNDVLLLRADPLLRNVESDPRFAQLMHRIGLDDE